MFDWNLVVNVPVICVQPYAAVHAPVPLISADPASQIFWECNSLRRGNGPLSLFRV